MRARQAMAPDYVFRRTWPLDLPLIARWLALPHLSFVQERLRNGVPQILTDPDPANARAIRAYEKAGFVRDRLVVTPDGPALLMVHDRTSLSSSLSRPS